MSDRKILAQEKAFRTMLLWLSWATVALVVYFALYLEMGVWDHVVKDKTRVTWIIFALFLIGVAMSFWLAVNLTNEMIRAIRIGMKARDQGLPSIYASHSGRGPVERFFASLKEVTARNDRPDVESLINVEISSYHRTSHTVDVMGTLLITLGLIGTVVGLSITLAGLSTTLDALGSSQERVLSGLRSAMGGMGTAFYATLMGAVLGGVLLRVFALITSGGIDSLSDSLKKICLVYCSSDLSPSVDRDLRFLNMEIANLGDNVKHLQAALSATKQAITEFRDEAQRLHQLGGEADQKETLRDAVVLQHYYSEVLKEEIKLMNKVNRAWWPRVKRALRGRG